MAPTRCTSLTAAADVVGAVSSLLGGLLLVAPRRGLRTLRLSETDDARGRALGSLDAALGVVTLAGRSAPWRWRAVAARSVLHLAFAGEYERAGRRPLVAAMGALFVLDVAIAAGLRSTRRRRG